MASGSGSNFAAIVEGCQSGKISAEVVGLIGDKPWAKVFSRAENLMVANELIELKDCNSKSEYETKIIEQFQTWQVDLICLAGYMKIVDQTLLSAYSGKIINIHPSLLPNYPGKDGLGDALRAGETTVGVTVHYVDELIDHGEIILQASFSVVGMELEAIETKLHQVEHELYVQAINKIISSK